MTEEKQLSLFGNPDVETAVETAPDPTPTNFEAIPTDASIPILPGTYSSLQQLIPHCQDCHRCELGSTRQNTVISRGNPEAKIMVIGEGPGQQEDKQGKPFVGKSGKLLEKILASVELSAEQDTYIANMVKCRPPGNRTPVAAEIAACKPYLLEQIRLVDPKIILFTGATALKGLTGIKQGISKVRGKWLEWNNRDCMAIFHPAYLLRNPSAEKGSPKWLMWQDIRTIRQRFDELADR